MVYTNRNLTHLFDSSEDSSNKATREKKMRKMTKNTNWGAIVSTVTGIGKGIAIKFGR